MFIEQSFLSIAAATTCKQWQPSPSDCIQLQPVATIWKQLLRIASSSNQFQAVATLQHCESGSIRSGM